jgi:hypothetical protein
MNVDFDTIFTIIEWSCFWHLVKDLGSRLITLDFLSTLHVSHDEVYSTCSTKSIVLLGVN